MRKRNILLLLVLAACVMAAYQYLLVVDGKLHVIFCNVGQGDAVLIKTPRGKQVLIDAGPSDAVLSCLADHMPFWDRTIELALLSHPHLDHYAGFTHILHRYRVPVFASESLRNDTRSFRVLEETIGNETKQQKLVTGDSYELESNVHLESLGPSDAFLAATSTNGQIRETGEFASVIALLRYHDFSLLLTGDAQIGQLAADTAAVDSIQVLHVPHHGSKTGLDAALLQRLQPKIGVISVGENSYGHPSAATLELLQQHKTRIFRTDRDGTVFVTTDGRSWSVNTD